MSKMDEVINRHMELLLNAEDVYSKNPLDDIDWDEDDEDEEGEQK